MIAQVKNALFYYAVQVYINDEWQTVETFKCQSYAIELRNKLLHERDLSIKDLLKKYVYEKP